MVFGNCLKCGKESEKHAKGMCVTCYKKLYWKPKIKICKKCNRELPIHAKGFCGGCYNTIFHLQATKDHNYKKYHNISPEVYRQLTEGCLICGFNDVVDLHHLDKNRSNNSENNLIGLCPNHHRMIHDSRYNDEIASQIKEKLTI